MILPSRSPRGFTIVEIITIMVVIAILVVISVVVYNGTQQRSRDARRISDMSAYMKALDLYKLENGQYPEVAYTGMGWMNGWEASSREVGGQFLGGLVGYGFSGSTPGDPINNATGDIIETERANGRYSYAYYRYPAGSGGCDSARGAFYVLGMLNVESNNGGNTHPNSPGFSCASRDWGAEFDWVTGKFER